MHSLRYVHRQAVKMRFNIQRMGTRYRIMDLICKSGVFYLIFLQLRFVSVRKNFTSYSNAMQCLTASPFRPFILFVPLNLLRHCRYPVDLLCYNFSTKPPNVWLVLLLLQSTIYLTYFYGDSGLFRAPRMFICDSNSECLNSRSIK